MTTSDLPGDLGNAALVVAHPDDEVLWFSSIVDRVGRIVFCFEECEDLPELGAARRALRADYPLAHVDWLLEPEPCSVQLVDWAEPDFGPHGLLLNAAGASDERRRRYSRSHAALREKLAASLRGKDHVFTHNPWGEYGHPDHSQVARVVESLQAELGCRVLYSGYVASRTMPLCARELPRLGRAFSLPTNAALAESMKELYRRHGCWTWAVDNQLFERESFLEADARPPRPGWGFALNCITA